MSIKTAPDTKLKYGIIRGINSPSNEAKPPITKNTVNRPMVHAKPPVKPFFMEKSEPK